MGTTKPPHILVVDDEQFILGALKLYFESNEFRVSTAANGQDALRIFRSEHRTIDVVILDLVMPGTHGLELLRCFKKTSPGVQVIIATGCGSMGSAIEALRLGAFDFITKPILDFDADLMKSVRNALEVRRRIATADSSEAPAPPATTSPEHWMRVYEELNEFAAKYIGKPPTPPVLEEVGRLLREGFGADAAALLVPDGADWRTACSWGIDASSGGLEDIGARLVLPAGAGEELELPGAPVPPLDPPEHWARTVPVPLLMGEGPQKVLVLLYSDTGTDEALRPEEGPVALMTTVLSPVLNQYVPPDERPETERDPSEREAAS